MDKEQIEQVEEIRSEEADDIYQSIEEESVETNKKGRARQILPRLSKTNQRVVISETSDHVKDMRRGSRKKFTNVGIFFLNIRGFNKSTKHGVVRNW